MDLVDLVSIFLILVYFVSNNSLNLCTLTPTLINSLFRTVVHANLTHLVLNLVSFRNISSALINKFSAKTYALVLTSLWILDGLSDYLSIKSGIKRCSIGFSGVVFGLITYYFLGTTDDYLFVASQLLLLMIPGLLIPGISNIGHFLGILNGFLIKMFV